MEIKLYRKERAQNNKKGNSKREIIKLRTQNLYAMKTKNHMNITYITINIMFKINRNIENTYSFL